MAKLIYRYGAMNSAKSARLIMDAFTLRQNGKEVLIFKPTTDTRDKGVVRSRAIPTELEADLVGADDVGVMFSKVARLVHANKPRLILVDEVQFFSTEQIEELATIVDGLGVTVMCYGLLTDFTGTLFNGSKRLVELADVVERIRSECTECGNEGVINARLVGGVVVTEGEQLLMGAEESYKVMCRSCFNEQVNRA